MRPRFQFVVGALGGAHVTLAEHQRRARVALDEALQRTEVVGGDQVVRVEALRMLAPVHPDRQRGEPLGGHLVEPQQRQVLVAVVVGEAGRGPVVGCLRPHDVALVQRVLHDRGAHAGRDQARLGLQDRVGHGPGLVLEHAQVDDVLEQPHAPRGGRVVRRRVVVGGRVEDVAVGDLRAGLAQQLADPPQQVVLGEVVVGLDQREPPPVRALDDDRADRQPRRHAVRVLLGGGVQVRIDVAAPQLVGRVPVVGVLAGGGADVPGRVDDPDPGTEAVPRGVGRGGRHGAETREQGRDGQGQQQSLHGRGSSRVAGA